MQSAESSGDNLRLSSCSAPSSRASGRQTTKVYSGRGSRHCYAIKLVPVPDCPAPPTLTLFVATRTGLVCELTIRRDGADVDLERNRAAILATDCLDGLSITVFQKTQENLLARILASQEFLRELDWIDLFFNYV